MSLTQGRIPCGGSGLYSIGYVTAMTLRCLTANRLEADAVERLAQLGGDESDMRLAASIFERAGSPVDAADLMQMVTARYLTSGEVMSWALKELGIKDLRGRRGSNGQWEIMAHRRNDVEVTRAAETLSGAFIALAQYLLEQGSQKEE